MSNLDQLKEDLRDRAQGAVNLARKLAETQEALAALEERLAEAEGLLRRSRHFSSEMTYFLTLLLNADPHGVDDIQVRTYSLQDDYVAYRKRIDAFLDAPPASPAAPAADAASKEVGS